jgi:hypothetical protein
VAVVVLKAVVVLLAQVARVAVVMEVSAALVFLVRLTLAAGLVALVEQVGQRLAQQAAQA